MKFKNIKQNKRKKSSYAKKSAKTGAGDSGKSTQFPNIYRIITENLRAKKPGNALFRLLNQAKLQKTTVLLAKALSIAIMLFLTVGIVILAAKLFQEYKKYENISLQRENLRGQIKFWQSVADKYPGYKDAYFRMALLEYQLNDYQKAKDANSKALILDPNFNDAKKLEVILEKK